MCIGQIEIRPGVIEKNGEEFTCRPILSTVVNLRAENNLLNYAVPGGLIGVGTAVDPTLCRADRLVGQVRARLPRPPSCSLAVQESSCMPAVGTRWQHQYLGAPDL